MSYKKGPKHTPKRCIGCLYRQREAISVCGYCLTTGEPRGSSVEDCTHYIPAFTGSQKRAYLAMMKRKKGENVLGTKEG